jgi:hypothetical protein
MSKLILSAASAAALAVVTADVGVAHAQIVITNGYYPGSNNFGSPSYYASPGGYGGYNPAYPGPYTSGLGGVLNQQLGGGTVYALPGTLGGYSTFSSPLASGVYNSFPAYSAYGSFPTYSTYSSFPAYSTYGGYRSAYGTGYGAYRSYGGMSYGYRRR